MGTLKSALQKGTEAVEAVGKNLVDGKAAVSLVFLVEP